MFFPGIEIRLFLKFNLCYDCVVVIRFFNARVRITIAIVSHLTLCRIVYPTTSSFQQTKARYLIAL